MDLHRGGELRQITDPIHKKQENKITKFLCLGGEMEQEKNMGLAVENQ